MKKVNNSYTTPRFERKFRKLPKRLKKNWNENEEKLWKYTVDIDFRIEPIGLTPEEFENNTDPLVFEIRNFGVRVK